ncbi:MAG TPA: hypothetical protein VND87_00690 [Stellaceae bacterium]|nr:hypothetical protein [Stellaceae bacterium]
MPPSIGFIAYSSSPGEVGQTIEAALRNFGARQGPERYSSWRENDVAGRFIAEPILESIQAAKCLVADVTVLNFNVSYEIGYAIGAGKRVVLIRNEAIESDYNERSIVGVFDTLGFKNYQNSDDL